MPNDPAGGVIQKRPPGQPEVSELTSNQTLLVSHVSPLLQEIPSEPLSAGSLTELAGKVNGICGIAQTFELSDVAFDPQDGAMSVKDPATAMMVYGADPKTIMDDFSLESLIAGIGVDSAEGSPFENRLLLRQRLLSLLIQQVLNKLDPASKTYDKKVADVYKDPAQRLALMASLDGEIARMQVKVDEIRLVHEAEGGN